MPILSFYPENLPTLTSTKSHPISTRLTPLPAPQFAFTAFQCHIAGSKLRYFYSFKCPYDLWQAAHMSGICQSFLPFNQFFSYFILARSPIYPHIFLNVSVTFLGDLLAITSFYS